ncbi:MAG TPA: N-acyl homoserine lactonase family protein [Burkholderiales bacterium]|jgi:glyoxylase-like metal-dependent hydrolase (beta-lactamase superfamily II)|nr:N-acyl homoserine lactonase family protein [Burkholderiales bacterium]
MSTPLYEVYAIKYAHHPRRASENFIGGDPHDGPMPLDYFVWLVRGHGHEIVVDTGFSKAVALKRAREHLRCPTDGLRMLGVDSAQVRDVVVTHLHYDHIGNFDLFPAATLHLQDLEMRYATGRYMCHECFRGAFEVEDVVGMVRRVYAGRVRFHDGDAELYPGVSLHLIGGHTMGLQAVRVMTRRGAVVLASDASHLYANMEQTRPFPIVWSVAGMVDGYRRLRELAESPAHVIPGHDPLVMERYPAPDSHTAGIVARLD